MWKPEILAIRLLTISLIFSARLRMFNNWMQFVALDHSDH